MITGYLPYQKLYQTVSVLVKGANTADADGGWTSSGGWVSNSVTFQAVLVSSRTGEIVAAEELRFPATHQIIADGPPQASVQDRLQVGSRVFEILQTEDPGEMGIATIYSVVER
jgi:hypothetical protein